MIVTIDVWCRYDRYDKYDEDARYGIYIRSNNRMTENRKEKQYKIDKQKNQVILQIIMKSVVLVLDALEKIYVV